MQITSQTPSWATFVTDQDGLLSPSDSLTSRPRFLSLLGLSPYIRGLSINTLDRNGANHTVVDIPFQD